MIKMIKLEKDITKRIRICMNFYIDFEMPMCFTPIHICIATGAYKDYTISSSILFFGFNISIFTGPEDEDDA